MLAQSDSLAVVSTDAIAEVVTPAPVIEYTMQRKTYEIADIKVTGADSYEDFVLIGFSGLAVGDKIKVTIRFKGRQMTHTELGEDVMNRFAERLSDIANVSDKPKLDGRTMTMMLTPKK